MVSVARPWFICGYHGLTIVILFQIKHVLLNFLFIKESKRNNIAISTLILSSTAVFNIDDNNLEHRISMLEWFLKDHVTGEMAVENFTKISQNCCKKNNFKTLRKMTLILQIYQKLSPCSSPYLNIYIYKTDIWLSLLRALFFIWCLRSHKISLNQSVRSCNT